MIRFPTSHNLTIRYHVEDILVEAIQPGCSSARCRHFVWHTTPKPVTAIFMVIGMVTGHPSENRVEGALVVKCLIPAVHVGGPLAVCRYSGVRFANEVEDSVFPSIIVFASQYPY